MRALEKALEKEVIDVDAASENALHIYSAIEELRQETEGSWKKLAVPLEQVIEANNTSNVHLKRRDVDLSAREDNMDGRVACNQVRINELQTKVTLAVLGPLQDHRFKCFRTMIWRPRW